MERLLKQAVPMTTKWPSGCVSTFSQWGTRSIRLRVIANSAVAIRDYDNVVALPLGAENAFVDDPGAVTELIAEMALALEMGATAEDLALTVHAHPTFAESLMEAAEVSLGRPIHERAAKK